MRSTKSVYRRVLKKRDEDEKIPENEIRLTARGTANRYIARAAELFLDKEKNLDTIILKAAGAAIPVLCVATEIIRRRVFELHQITNITYSSVVDEYEPTEEGLDVV